MSLALYVLYLWFTSNRMSAMFDFANMHSSWRPVNPMAVSTSGPNFVLLEESEPNISFIALTLPYTVLIKFAQVNTSCYYKQNTGITLVMVSI